MRAAVAGVPVLPPPLPLPIARPRPRTRRRHRALHRQSPPRPSYSRSIHACIPRITQSHDSPHASICSSRRSQSRRLHASLHAFRCYPSSSTCTPPPITHACEGVTTKGLSTTMHCFLTRQETSDPSSSGPTSTPLRPLSTRGYRYACDQRTVPRALKRPAPSRCLRTHIQRLR